MWVALLPDIVFLSLALSRCASIEHYISLHQSCQAAYVGFLCMNIYENIQPQLLVRKRRYKQDLPKSKRIRRRELNQHTQHITVTLLWNVLCVCCNDWILQMSTCQSRWLWVTCKNGLHMRENIAKSDETNYHRIYESAQCWIRSLLAPLFSRAERAFRLFLLLK